MIFRTPSLHFPNVRMAFTAGVFALSTSLLSLWVSSSSHGQTNTVTTVSAASFTPPLAAEAIASAFGSGLATDTEVAVSQPLPTTLAGTTVRVRGALAPLFFVSPNQINYLIPAGTSPGEAEVVVTAGNGVTSTGTVQIRDVSPAIFTTNASGQGLPAAVLLRVKSDGRQLFEPANVPLVFQPDGSGLDRLFLILYASGVRAASAGAVKVLIAGNELPTAFAAAPGFAGLDQVNVELESYLSGRGRLNLQIKAGEALSNIVEIEMGGPDLRATPATTVISSANPAVAGQEIVYTVRVTAAGNSRLPTGNVSLTENGAMIGKKPLDGSGQATFTYLLNSIGGRTIAASYEGDNFFKESGGALGSLQMVNKAQANVTLSSSNNPANLAQTVTLTALVHSVSPSTLTPTGVVQFKENNAALGTPITLVNGRADFSVNALTLGARGITAEYYGEPNVQPADSSAFVQTIGAAPLQIIGITRGTPVFAGDEIIIHGSGFTANPADHEIKLVADDGQETTGLMAASAADQLIVRVPFGAGSGKVKVSVGGQEIEGGDRLEIGTSVSGLVQEFRDGSRKPVAGMPVTLIEQGGRRVSATTNSSGAFLLRNASPSTRSTIQISGQASNGLPYETPPIAIRVRDKRDNQMSRDDSDAIIVEVKSTNATSTNPIAPGAAINETLRVNSPAAPGESTFVITSGQVVFDTNNSTVACPGNSGCQLALTVFDPRRTPANLPAGRFSSTIAQITPFGATLAPGGKLTFPNSDNIPQGTAVRLFRFDQNPASATFGQFVDIGPASISGDGTKIETAANAVTEASYYFVSRQWPAATVIGFVTEADGRPVRRAVVTARGQSVFTGNNGGFVLSSVPVITPDGTNDQVMIETSFVRADGSVAQTERTVTGLRASESRNLTGDFVLPRAAANRAPQIIAPPSLVVMEGETRNFNFLVSDPDGHTVSLALTGAPFATITGSGNQYTLRLTPGANTANNYTLAISATDAPGNRLNLTTTQSIALTVLRGDNKPTANYASVTTDEDTPVNITLNATNPGGGSLTYSRVIEPAHGALTGTAPNLIYTPSPNFNGADAFSFMTTGSNGESNVATVFIAVKAVNDAPALAISTPTSLSANAGETVKIDLSAADVDAEQTLSFSVTGLPPGASFVPSAASAQFRWTPTFAQAGTYAVSFAVNDNGSPSRADGKMVAITTDAKWAKTSGPEGGAIISFLHFGETLYAGTSGGGIYRSTNNGNTWVQSRNGLTGRALTVNAMTTSGNSIFAATFDGVYRSSDNGQSWQRASRGFPSGDVPVFALLVRDGMLFAGSGDLFGNGRGMFRSADNGENWVEINNGLTRRNITSLARIGNALFASTGHLEDLFNSGGLYRSVDNGNTWTLSANGLSFFGTVLPITALLATDNAFFAATFAGLFRSLDNGQNWSQVGGGLPEPTSFPVISLAVRGSTLFAGTFGAGVFRSDNNGASWTSANNGLTDFALNVLRLLVTENGDLFAGTGDLFGRGGGLYRSIDGANSWQLTRSGITASLALALLQTDNGLFVGTAESGINRSMDNGQSWTPVNNGLTGSALVVYALAKHNGDLLAGTDGDGVYRSANNGQTWVKSSAGMPDEAMVYSLRTVGNSLYAGTYGWGVYRSTDNGRNWIEISDGLEDDALYVFAFQPVTNGLLAATDDGIYRLADNGQAWTRASNGLGFDGLFVRAFLSTQNLLLAATLGGGVYRSTDNGQTWRRSNTGLSGEALNALTLLALGDGIYLGTASLNVGGESVFRSTDGGQSWQPFRSSFDQQSIYALATDGQRIFAASFGDGVFVLASNVQSWAASNTNLGNRFINSVLTTNASTLLTGTLGGGVFRSTTQGQSWQPSTGLPANANVQALAASGSQVFAGLLSGGVYRSASDGASWSLSGLANQTINALKVSSNGEIFAATDAGVQRSSDQGASWQPAGLNNLRVASLVFSGSRLFAGTYGNGIYASNDNGANWTQAGSSANGLANPNAVALTLGADGTTLFAGTDGGGIYHSLNGGASWTAVNNDLPPTLNVYSFAVSGGKLYAGSIYGVFLSEDNGAKWTQLNAGLLDIYATSLAVSGQTLIAGTRLGGIFTSQIP